MSKNDTIPMERDAPTHAGGPVTADVHPEEVAHWEARGWRKAVMADTESDGAAAKGKKGK